MCAHAKMRRVCVLSARCGGAKVAAGIMLHPGIVRGRWPPCGHHAWVRNVLPSVPGVSAHLVVMGGRRQCGGRPVLVSVAVVVLLMVMVVVQLLVHGACSRG